LISLPLVFTKRRARSGLAVTAGRREGREARGRQDERGRPSAL